MRFQAVPDYQQRLFQVRFKRFEKTGDFFFLDAAFVQPEQAIGARQARDDGDMVPVEVKLNHRRLSFQIPGAHLRGTFAEARFVDKDDQAAFSPGFFFERGPSAAFPCAHRIIVALDGAFFRLLGAETQCAENAPDVRLSKTHAMQALNDHAHALERPQFGAEPMHGRVLQNRRPYRGQLRRIELGRSASPGYRTQRID